LKNLAKALRRTRTNVGADPGLIYRPQGNAAGFSLEVAASTIYFAVNFAVSSTVGIAPGITKAASNLSQLSATFAAIFHKNDVPARICWKDNGIRVLKSASGDSNPHSDDEASDAA
jgi:hypothetical protein